MMTTSWSKGAAPSPTRSPSSRLSPLSRVKSSRRSSTSTTSQPATAGPRSGFANGATPADSMAFDERERDELRRKFQQFAETRDHALFDELVTAHLGLAEYLARRVDNRGEPVDALAPVASGGLVKAVDRFDPDRGLEFSTYATPTIVGELKRHFRDKGWAVRVPRRVQELHLRLAKVIDDLATELGRSPTVQEIAHRAG